MGFFSDYKAWLSSASQGRELADYTHAMWQALQEPELLNNDSDILYKCFAYMQMCKGSKRRQYNLVSIFAFRDAYSRDDLELCLFGKLIQKLLDVVASLTIKKSELPELDFHKYLFRVCVNILGNCLTELGLEINGANQERQELSYDSSERVDYGNQRNLHTGYEASMPPSIEILQYRINLRHRARLLSLHIREYWKERELNVLCHHLESGGGKSARLKDESQSNIYKLHQRIRDKLKQTIEDQGFSEDVGRVFVGYFLNKLCQNCKPLNTYKGIKKAKSEGGSNAEKI